MIYWTGIIITLLAGFGLPIQAGLNAQLSKSAGTLGSAVYASLISFVFGSLCLFVYYLTQKFPWPAFSDLSKVPWYYWVGGAIGAFYVFVATSYAPRLGIAVFIGVTVTGQMLASITLDHTAKLGFAHNPISWEKILGVLMIVGGVALIQFKRAH